MCSKGKYSKGGESVCHNCGTNKFQNQSGQSSCKNCASTSYQNQSGQSSCKGCPSGKYGGGAGKSCKSCSSNKYQNLSSQKNCKNCANGRFQNQSGKSSCKACPAGKYGGGTGKSCLACPANQYNDQAGRTGCKSCPRGTNTGGWTGRTSSAQCQCGKGTKKVGSHASLVHQCSNCEAGRFQDSDFHTISTCKLCQTGRFNPYTGKDQCYYCPWGMVTNGGGKTAATDCKCSEGEHLAANSKACTNCAPGKFQEVKFHRTYSCKSCAPDKYQSVKGSNDCIACKSHLHTNGITGSTAPSACQCGAGTRFQPLVKYQAEVRSNNHHNYWEHLKDQQGPWRWGWHCCWWYGGLPTWNSYRRRRSHIITPKVDRIEEACPTCPFGKYQSSPLHLAESCKTPKPGYVTSASQTSIVACGPGTYPKNNKCEKCPSDRWSPGALATCLKPNACDWGVSGYGEWMVAEFTPTSDRVCASHKKCNPKTQYISKHATKEVGGDVECSQCPCGHSCDGYKKSMCAAGTYMPLSTVDQTAPCKPNSVTSTSPAHPGDDDADKRYSSAGACTYSICTAGSFTSYKPLPAFRILPISPFSRTRTPLFNFAHRRAHCMGCYRRRLRLLSPFLIRRTGGYDMCTECPAGHECDGSSKKLKCGKDWLWNPAGSDTKCRTCGAGWYTSGGGAAKDTHAACDPCPAGSECPGGSAVTECGLGHFSGDEASKCSPCGAANLFAWEKGTRDACHKCPNKYFTSGSSSEMTRSRCQECPAGHSCDGARATPCAPGSASAKGVSDCATCAAGTYAGKGSPVCQPCPATHFSLAGAGRCEPHTVCVDPVGINGAGEYMKAEGTPTSNRMCTPLDVCNEFQWIEKASTSTSARVCSNCPYAHKATEDKSACWAYKCANIECKHFAHKCTDYNLADPRGPIDWSDHFRNPGKALELAGVHHDDARSPDGTSYDPDKVSLERGTGTGNVRGRCYLGKQFMTTVTHHARHDATCVNGHWCGMGVVSGDATKCECAPLSLKPAAETKKGLATKNDEAQRNPVTLTQQQREAAERAKAEAALKADGGDARTTTTTTTSTTTTTTTTPAPCVCAANYDPVVCSDGIAYGNKCEAGCAGKSGCKKVATTTPAPTKKPTRMCACTKAYKPVKCSDGIQYGNLCDAKCKHAVGCRPA